MNLTHFQTMALFAFIVSLAFAFLSRRRLRSRIRYLIWAFTAFLLVAIAIGWIMYPASH
jgi:cell division septal protein FtsQ